MSAAKTLLTAEELLCLPDDGMRHELVKGVLRTMPPAGGEHGFLTFIAGSLIGTYVRVHRLGHMFGAETGFKIARAPDTVRAPDVAFVAKGRFPGDQLPTTYPELAPDLVVEVVSPGDRAAEIAEKVQTWLHAGVRVVVVVNPRPQSVRVHRPGHRVEVLAAPGELDLDDVLPGFRCRVADLFPTV